ncbi:MAG: hypothetical protein HOP07_17460 [Bacteriovoracaceae bacterium]|nr:hypothetical protein [Bacteriovoracaceae bacterium]
MKLALLIFSLVFFPLRSESALEYSKLEFPGCPENAFCKKNTGEVRQKWIEELDQFIKNKISESIFNQNLQKNHGMPVASWALEEASILPNIMMWDSPCSQHKKEASKFYISEIFKKNLKEADLKDSQSLYFSRAYGIGVDKKIFSVIIPRGETPLFIENGYYYFLEDEEGKYFGLLINQKGDLKITKIQSITETAKDSVCIKEQVDQFLREAPSPTFYKGYTCKEIWDKTNKVYRPMLFGWSCN